MAVAKLSAALIVNLDGTRRRISEAKIAFGFIAPAAFVDEGVAAVLRAQPLEGATIEAFAAACSSMVSRSIPERSSLPYKRHAVRGLAHDLWSEILGGR